MPWTATFHQDTDADGVGTVTAALDGFHYARRVDTTDGRDVEGFVAEAREKFASLEGKKDATAAVADSVASQLNA
jgi:hypothetical protein